METFLKSFVYYFNFKTVNQSLLGSSIYQQFILFVVELLKPPLLKRIILCQKIFEKKRRNPASDS